MVVPCADRWPAGHIFSAFVSPVCDGLIVAQRPGNRIILCDTSGDLDQEADCLGVLISHRVDGLVIAPVSDLSRGNLNRLSRHGMPFVHIDRTIHGVECDEVQGDSSGGAFQIGRSPDQVGHGVSRLSQSLPWCQRPETHGRAPERRGAVILPVDLIKRESSGIRPA